MQEKNPGYIKDIESYFLKITRKGLMLSGKDYNLINNWYEQSIPKETVIKAIQNAVKDKDLNKIKSISSLEDNIEDYINSTFVKDKDNPNNLSKTDAVAPILHKIDSIINSETDDNIKNNLIKARHKIEQLKSTKTESFYLELKKIESDFFDNLFENIDQSLRQAIRNESEKKLSKEAKYFDEETKETTVKAFRNEIVQRNFNLKNIFDLK